LFLSAYSSALVCKSGALISALACGCLPVLREARQAAPLTEDRELLVCDGSNVGIDRLVKRVRTTALGPLAEAGWRWFAQNATWRVTARRVAELVRQVA
jgi:hypothetical protein